MAVREGKRFEWLGQAVDGFLLDFDGTIADTKEAHTRAWEIWAARHGIDVDREAYMRDYFGRSNKEVMPELLPHLADNPAALRAIAMERELDFIAVMIETKTPPMPGVLEFVQRAHRRGMPLAIASSAPRENIETLSAHYGLTEYIPIRLSMDDVTRAKPAPDLYLLAAERLGVDARRCVVFEDSRFGLESGRAAGARTVAILSLHDPGGVQDLADLCVRDFEDLLRRRDWRDL